MRASPPAGAPTGPRAGDPVSALSDLARSAVRRAARRARHVDGSLEALHDARKAAKRARYVIEELDGAEVLGSTSGLRKAAKRASAVHDAIGAHRDLELVLEQLPIESVRATAAGENAFVYGMLAERGARKADRLLRRAHRAVDRFRAAVR